MTITVQLSHQFAVEIDTCCAGDGAGTDSYGTGFEATITQLGADVDGDGGKTYHYR